MGHACLTDVYTLIVLTVCTYYFGFSNEKNKKRRGDRAARQICMESQADTCLIFAVNIKLC